MSAGAPSDESLARFDAALTAVRSAGLNVQAVLDTTRVSDALPGLDTGSWPSLLLLGSTGTAMWLAMQAVDWLGRPDPIDTWCSAHLSRMRQALPMRAVFVFPSQTPVDVLSFGRAAGWAHPSPLRLGIHPEHGLWVGYRGAVLLNAHVPERGVLEAASPCDSCVDTPCVSACPATAVRPDGLHLETCFGERLAPTRCASSCASRLACPVGAESRCGVDQMTHHQNAGNRLYRTHAEDRA